nr:CAZy families GH38 protein [uncultured bacterium]
MGVEIQNTVDIQKTNNFEIVMRLSTNINNTDEFFTDSNGYQVYHIITLMTRDYLSLYYYKFQVIRRKRFKKLPLQANFYPMPTKAYIEDKTTRLTSGDQHTSWL